mgnify:CR=1 FL=1
MQLVGYVLYIADDQIDPNPVTWFMFAYGTTILTVLEWDSSATLPEFFLLIVCSVCGIYISVRCWFRARKKDPLLWWPKDWWPEDKLDQVSFISDILITVGYIAAWVCMSVGVLSGIGRDWWVLAFLILSSVSTFPAYFPILQGTYRFPERENWRPWFVWSFAYFLMGIAIHAKNPTLWQPLMIYPASNVLMSGLVGWFARPKAILDREKARSSDLS